MLRWISAQITAANHGAMLQALVATSFDDLKALFMKAAAASIDAYLAELQDDQRVVLETLRRQIRAVVPEAEEAISYGLPTFKLHGNLVHFGAAARHCSLYAGSVIGHLAEQLAAFDTSKGTIRFQPDRPLPEALVREIVQFRVVQNLEIAAERAMRKRRKT